MCHAPAFFISILDYKEQLASAELRAFNEGCKMRCPVFPPSLQSTSGLTQVGLHPQGVRLLRSAAVPQASSDVFAFTQAACSLEQHFAVDDVNTPKVGPIFHCEIRNICMSPCALA